MNLVSRSSPENTRGLIEAARPLGCRPPQSAGLPRGIPAASLKQLVVAEAHRPGGRLPRGIPAASLKHPRAHGLALRVAASSAGNTRGLIEACATAPTPRGTTWSSAGNTRGLIEARWSPTTTSLSCGLPRGIPAASLKRDDGVQVERLQDVFRGEYPRPH